MAESHPNPILNHLRHLVGGDSAATRTDGELLERFLDHGDESAIAVLVRRYGSLVLGVCRRVLHDAHASEDAFQATFLILARRAPSLDRTRPLGSWLYTVSYRLAVRIRANESRRRRYEAQSVRVRPSAEYRAENPSDLVIALEEELHRLPERHRAPLVLCYLEGKTNDQAAAALGCPRGSMAARLDQARERLRAGLARRGFTAPAAVAAALAAVRSTTAAPLPLVDGTVRAALWFARGQTGTAAFVSARAVAWARLTCRALFLHRLKLGAALLVAATMLGAGASVLLRAAPQAALSTPEPDQLLPEVRPGPNAVPDRAANAALAYGQALIALRRGFGDPDKLFAECLTTPLDGHARETVTRAAYALQMLRRGATLPRCDWALEQERGIDVSFSHADGARVLAALACLRARLGFEEGRDGEALDDIAAALALARHVSRDGTLDSLRAGYDVEQRLSETLAPELNRLGAKQVRDFLVRLDALPAAGSVATATRRMEETLLDWIVGELREARDRGSLLAFLSQLCGSRSDPPEKNRAKAETFLKECGGTGAGVLRAAQEMRADMGALAQTLDLPPGQAGREFGSLEKKLADNPVFQVFAPVLHNILSRQEQAAVRRALLAAALAVRLDGPDALKKYPDPAAGGLFVYIPFEGGFDLRSQLKVEGKPVSLTVGRRGK